MKGRLNTAIWTLSTINAIALFVVLYLAYSAGAHANGLGIVDALTGSAPGKSPLLIFLGLFVSVAMSIVLLIALGNKVSKPVSELVIYSHKFAAGEYSSRP